MIAPLVTNMGTVKNPWDDVPIEVLIEYERKKILSKNDTKNCHNSCNYITYRLKRFRHNLNAKIHKIWASRRI